MHRRTWVGAVVLLVSCCTAATARADGVHPQISYSVGVGKSDGSVYGHMWLGAGVRWKSGGGSAPFTLLGIEAEIRDPVEHPDAGTARMSGPISESGGPEAWLALRTGIGEYKARGWAPLVAFYVLAGRRVAGAEGGQRMRLGLGVSVPAALPLAQIGIPTMIEGGVDFADGRDDEDLRGFVRAGWNF
jgi:hypothetical protein